MYYLIEGKVIKGDGYGKKIGFPTINLDRKNYSKLEEKPPFGVYAGAVTLGSEKYRAGIIIGPLDDSHLPKIEAHLIGFRGSAYGKLAVFEIKKFIRKYKLFTSKEKLIMQIEKDLRKC